MDDNSYSLFVFSISLICSFSKICASFFFRKMNIPLCCHFTHNNNNDNDNDNDRASAPMKAHSYDHPCTTKPPAAPPNPKSRYLLQKLYRKTLRPTRNLLPGEHAPLALAVRVRQQARPPANTPGDLYNPHPIIMRRILRP